MAYYSKFPEDVDRVKSIMQYLKENNVSVPSGKLSPERFQQLGLVFGMHGKRSDLYFYAHDSNLHRWL
jgi:proline iminopeptidase